MTSTDPLNLDAIEARATRLYERTASIDPNAHPDFGQLTDTDVPALVAEVRRLRDRVTELENAPLCGKTWGANGNEYSPCARREGHEEAYCRSADGNDYFLAAADDCPGCATPAR